jgi:hypothetical protein
VKERLDRLDDVTARVAKVTDLTIMTEVEPTVDHTADTKG